MFYYIMQYFTNLRPLELERIKTIRIPWVRCLLRVKNEALSSV